MAYDKPSVVIDNGSYCIKAGFACDNHPVSMFRTVVARPGYLHGSYGRTGNYEVYIGGSAVARIESYDLNNPIENGRIVHWDNMERVWHHIYYKELKVAPEDRAVIMAVSPTTPMSEKIRCCQVFFETLNVPAFCIQPQSSLALYGSGFTTGITIDLGFDTTDINPVYEGGLIKYAHMTTGYAGAQICSYIQNRLLNKGIDLGIRSGEILDDMIRKCLYVTPDAAISRKKFKRPYWIPYQDPTKSQVDLFDEAFMAAELYFQPNLVLGRETNILPIQSAFTTSTMKCDGDLRPELYSAVVTTGGLSMIPGINERLKIEIEEMLDKPINLVTSEESYVVSWMGGATFAGIPEAQKMSVTKKQYEDHGARIVKNRFL